MFSLAKIENGRINVAEPELLPVTASEAIAVGEALVLSSGKLTKCGAEVKPTFIAESACTAGASNSVYVHRINPEQVYRVPIKLASTSLSSGVKVGVKITIYAGDASTYAGAALYVEDHYNGESKATSGTYTGVATVVDLNGAAASGDEIYVRFE